MERGIVYSGPFYFVRRIFYDLGTITPVLNYGCICFILQEFEIMFSSSLLHWK